jgi:uridine phosphorylase
MHRLTHLSESFLTHTHWPLSLPEPYFIRASEPLRKMLTEPGMVSGITLSTPGFYAPQFRSLRLEPMDPGLLEEIGSFRFENLRVNNFEMESSALFALAAMLNHHAITLCVAVANRISLQFLDDYQAAVDGLIESVLNKLTGND